MESIFGPIRHTIDYAEAEAAGLVAPIKVATVEVDTRITCVSSIGKTLQAAKKRWCYWRNEARNQAIAWAANTIPGRYGFQDPQVLILVETLEHAFRISRSLPDYAVVYATANPVKFNKWKEQNLIPKESEVLTSDKRTAMLKDFMSGKLRKVIATSTWGTGVDFVNLDVLVYASGAPGEIRTTQWPGRNSRTRQGKKFGLMIDFTDTWDIWTRRRAQQRLKTYKKHGWSITNAGPPQLNYQTEESPSDNTVAADAFNVPSPADQAGAGAASSVLPDEDSSVSGVPAAERRSDD
jgi:superfamily II DNA or RNA helicase